MAGIIIFLGFTDVNSNEVTSHFCPNFPLSSDEDISILPFVYKHLDLLSILFGEVSIQTFTLIWDLLSAGFVVNY